MMMWLLVIGADLLEQVRSNYSFPSRPFASDLRATAPTSCPDIIRAPASRRTPCMSVCSHLPRAIERPSVVYSPSAYMLRGEEGGRFS